MFLSCGVEIRFSLIGGTVDIDGGNSGVSVLDNSKQQHKIMHTCVMQCFVVLIVLVVVDVVVMMMVAVVIVLLVFKVV